MDGIKWDAIADILAAAFYTKLTACIYRTKKDRDLLGGDIERLVLMYKDVPCYESQHPKKPSKFGEIPGFISRDAEYTVHFHPSVDVREGDVLVVHDRCNRKFQVGRVAYYPSHTRVECRQWSDITG